MILFYNGNGEDCVLEEANSTQRQEPQRKVFVDLEDKAKKLLLMTFFGRVFFLAIELALQVCYTATLLEEEKKNFRC